MTDQQKNEILYLERSRRIDLAKIFRCLCWLLICKAFVVILFQYRYYFPLDFQQSRFLAAHQSSFTFTYGFGFYLHLLVAPITLLNALVLYFGSFKGKLHRWLGRSQAVLVVAGLFPSGLIMAVGTIEGPVAAAGFVGLTLATTAFTIMAAIKAIGRDFVQHRLWATRALLCLLSPVILRIYGGMIAILDAESSAAYAFIAWSSWVVPLLIMQWVLWFNRRPIGIQTDKPKPSLELGVNNAVR